MRKLARWIVILLVVVFLLMPSTQVLAIADPNTPPQISAVEVFYDLLEDGDLGVLIDYYLDYDPVPGIPDEVVTEAYLASFIDTDGTTQLDTIAPYTFQDSGYGRGLVWIYFTAAEVTADSIDRANEALYTVWFMGNPTIPSGWAGDPPKTIASIDTWQPVDTNTATQLGLRVLYYADQLELAWSLDLVETTTIGSRLTALGEAYFPNVITGLRTMAPNVFAVATIEPEVEILDYSTAFGATITDGTGSIPVSPLTLVEGEQLVDVTGNGTLILELVKGTEGTAASNPGGATVDDTPAILVEGTNTITVTMAGTNDIIVTVNLVDTTTGLEDTVIGTAFDTTTLAATFGMSRIMFSSLVWLVITVIICAVYIKGGSRVGISTGGKGLVIIFDICIIIGIVLGLLSLLVGVLLGILFLFLTGWILYYRRAGF